jgi:ankyrin repeat protein
MLAFGAVVDAADEDGVTALFVAALQGRTEIVRMLLEHGADPSRAAFNGVTPREAAESAGHAETAELLSIR